MKSALGLLASERKRQIAEENWSEEQDKTYKDGQLAILASLYALPESKRTYIPKYTSDGHIKHVPLGFPDDFNCTFWKPSRYDRIRELVKAGALILAEIERLQSDDK